MVGFQFDVLDSKCSSHVGHAHVLLLDLMLVYFTTLSSHIHASSASCKATNLSSKYQHCAPRPDGVRDLDCYRKYPSSATTCVWKPGNHTSDKTYTLIVQQPQKNYCKIYSISKSSTKIQPFGNHNMTVQVFENSNWANCTKDFFRGLPKNLLRCGPPVNVLLKRHSGGLDVDVSWPTSDVKLIINYSLRYKEQGNASWDKAFIHLCDAQSPVESQSGNRCRVGNLDPSLVYVVQMQCVTNSKCTQCPWSRAYTVPPELRTPPAIVDLQDTDIPEKNGRRLVSVTWKFSAEELHDGYSVTVGKMSGEPPQERLNTSEPRIRLVLSYSAYRLDVRAVNNASTSPAARLTIPEREAGAKDGRLNVTVHSNTSFTVHWRDSLVQKYVCYCVEWRKKGDKVAYMSFHQNKQNHRDIESLTEPLEPYQRYNITLHTRPDKDTCNLKFFNGSESTYGSTQFYFIEGTPLSAPQNMRSYNVTLTSVVLEWLSIPEEETRGFLLGYIIHFSDYSHRGTGPENNVTVAPELNSYELLGLTSGTTYKVQISGFTSAGAGVRSNGLFITTDHEGYYSLITVFAVVATVLICGTPIIKRAKVVLWPSIPSPGYSNAMQKIVGPCELELLEAIKTLKVEEWDTKSLQIVEKEAVIPASTLPSMLPLLSDSVDEADSAELTCDWFQRDTDDTSGDVLPDDTSLDAPQTVFRSPPFAFPSGYTTLEMLQQVIPQGTPPVDTTEVTESEPEDAELTVVKSGVEYVRQFSTSPIMDSDQMSTIL